MKTFLTALALTLIASSGFAQCTSAHRVSARKEAHQSSAVIVGTVTSVQGVSAAWDFFDGVSYTVRVDSVIHGKTPQTGEVKIFSENSPKFFPMVLGQHYVLYVQPEFDRYVVDNCGNSHQTDQTIVLKSQLN